MLTSNYSSISSNVATNLWAICRLYQICVYQLSSFAIHGNYREHYIACLIHYQSLKQTLNIVFLLGTHTLQSLVESIHIKMLVSKFCTSRIMRFVEWVLYSENHLGVLLWFQLIQTNY
jgi:hypothetical protein